ncbi:hypothetical protein L6164_023885 [Bauhinia variegata]|uniref:Uncharacterized protein n=1 Tax=Bauhinia variegata TaxID=167791 RepID=A0ACB9MK21_BAUVA|nr:hypothetical protein L6164_023885 [Bauhinia variegata]
MASSSFDLLGQKEETRFRWKPDNEFHSEVILKMALYSKGTRGRARILSSATIILFIFIFPLRTAAQEISFTNSTSDNVSVSEVMTEQDSENDSNSNINGNTVRVDPLDNFRKYRGGFDITNKHYWSSVIFTGVYGYAIGVICLLCGMAYGIFLLTVAFCCKTDRNRKVKNSISCSYKTCQLWPSLLAILLTVLAMGATGLVLAGSARFHSEAGSVVKIIMRTANEATQTIYNTTGAMKDMQINLLESNDSDTDTSEASEILNSTSEQLASESANIEEQARKNRRLINKDLKVIFVVTVVTISLNLVASIALSVSGVLRLRRALYLLIILCWLMTVLCWLFFGVYFFLENFSSDACTAVESFEENPYNNSLSSILPCGELLSAKSVLSDVSAGIYNLVNEVNANISMLQATEYPSLVQVCNPFSAPPEYTYQPQNCAANTIRIGDIPKVLKIFNCSDAIDGTCNNGEFISDTVYRTVEAYTSSIQRLLNVYPGMENLVECESVKDAFSEILHTHCKPLKRFARIAWSGMVILSLIMVFLVLLWTIKARHEQIHHCFSDGSVKLHSHSEVELEEAKEIDHNSSKS